MTRIYIDLTPPVNSLDICTFLTTNYFQVCVLMMPYMQWLHYEQWVKAHKIMQTLHITEFKKIQLFRFQMCVLLNN